jgi:FkbM family methyltransferase
LAVTVVAYIGNFEPPFSTENHVKRALTSLGHQVLTIQESDPDQWSAVLDSDDYDVVLWTRTWHSDPEFTAERFARAKERGVSVVGFHLDRWFGLAREHELTTEPFFTQSDLVVTADGGHDTGFAELGINHLWMPPAVDHVEASQPGVRRQEFVTDVAFVGNWRSYHPEWTHRTELVDWLSRNFRRRFKAFPVHPMRPVRGTALNDLYASVAVVVGDSCLVGNATHYWSDRIPETLGRGGLLVHPDVVGLDQHFTPGQHLGTWPLGNWDALGEKIEMFLSSPSTAKQVREDGRAHVLKCHTYKERMAQLMTVLTERDMFPSYRKKRGVTKIRYTRSGVSVTVNLREGSDDAIVFDEVWRENVYRVQPGWVAGGRVVDIGANVGAFSLWAHHHGARVVDAFEPDPSNVEQLRLNTKGTDINIIPAAVHANSGTARYISSGRTGSGKVEAAGDAGQPIRAVSLKDAIGSAAVDVLKVDVEGSEYDIFHDHTDLAPVKHIVMEFHPIDAARFGSLLTVLCQWGHVEIMGSPVTGGMIFARRYRV